MRLFRWSVCLILTLVCLFATRPALADKPNILFIFADDQCYETVAAHPQGLTEVHTPNLDKLVKRGVTFTHTYNMGSWSGAVCVASRTMLNTGRFLWHAHKLKPDKEQKEGRFWSEHLKKAGYETYMTGKWHVRAKTGAAFHHASHERPGMPNQTKEGYHRPKADGSDPWSPYDPKFGGFWKGGRHWSAIVADDALKFLEHAKTKTKKPFFMYLAFNAPHDPRQSPKEYVDMYPLDKVAIPKNYLAEYPHKDPMGAGRGLRDEKLGPFPRTHHAVKVHRQEYYAIITHMDAQIGRILDGLEKSGKADNTYIFFTADHGLGVGHHGLFGKQNMYDHSVRVPFMMVGPKVPAGKAIDTRVYLQDVVPTTLELAGVDKPDSVEFRSLLPIVRGERKTQYDAIYGAYLDKQRMVTEGDYKLILYPKAGVVRLFNLKDDPAEMHDLASSPAEKSRIKGLFATLLKLQKQMGDDLDLKKAYPDL